MRLVRSLYTAGAATAVVLTAACGSSTGTKALNLTNAEAAELFAEMAQALAGTGVSLSSAHPMALAPRSSFAPATNISLTVSCTPGGTVGVSGTVNSSGTNSVSVDLTETFNSCKTVHFTVGGSLHITGSATTSPSTVTFQEAVKGTLTVTRNADGTSGSCSIDFSVNGSVNLQTNAVTVTASGTICGVNASAAVTT